MPISPVYSINSYTQMPAYQQPSAATFPLPVYPYKITHLRYDEAKPWELSAISADGKHRLRHQAARAFVAMQQAARYHGIDIQPVSAFRSVEEQIPLFYEEARKRNQTLAQRAQVVAPPGYSEHLTGYVLDIKDGRDVQGDALERTFEQTSAFSWLCQNAAQYGFELSFPQGNWQGISYEPWHWRYVGDMHSQQTFMRAKRGCV